MIDKTANETQKIVQIICNRELLPKIISGWWEIYILQLYLDLNLQSCKN